MRYFLFVICLFSTFKLFGQEFKEAVLAYEAQEYDEARLIIDQLIEKGNQNAEVWYYRGKIYASIANDLRGIYLKLDTLALFKAYDSFIEALKIENSAFKDSARAGLDSLYNTALNSSGKYFKQAFQREKQSSSQNDTRTYNLFRAAYGAANLAIRLNPKKDTLGYAIAAYAALSTGYYDDYIEATENLIKQLPDQMDKYRHYEGMIAICRDRINDLDLTLSVLDKALIVFPEDEKFQTERININDELGKNHDKLLEDTKAKIKANPREPVNYYNLAVIYQRMERFDEAIENYKICIDLDQSNFDAMFNTAGIYYNRGIEKLKKISKLTFTEYQLRGEKDEASANLDFKQALAAFEMAYRLYPNNIKILAPIYFICKRLKLKEKETEIKNRIDIIEPDFFKSLEKSDAASSNQKEE